MAATIVYEGVGGGGELFSGIKFFLLQRIPTRNHFKDLIVANGGEVVPLEKQADIVIGDHARKDQPEGSISWTFIESSIRNGRVEDVENHRAGPITPAVRQVGSAQPTKKGRTPFTPEDDRVLTKWCASAERKGLSLKGNEIYQQLEAINNRHTFQSWRDRWIKHVSALPRPENNVNEEDNENEEEDDEPGPSRRPIVRAPPRSSVARPTATSALPTARIAPRRPTADLAQEKSVRSPPLPRSPGANPFVQKSAGGNVFSDEETEELVAHYDDIVNLSDDQIIDAWIAWASANPNHTAQEWRNYFIEYVVPKVEAEEEPEMLQPPAKAPGKAPRTIQTIPGPHSSKSTEDPVLEVRDSQGSSGQNLESPKQGKKVVDPSTTDESVFKEQLLFLADQFGLDVDFKPKICGRTIPLFRLWQVVESDEFGGFDAVVGQRLWPKVARQLNFNEFKHPQAAAELQDCFAEILADFEMAKNETPEDASLTESQEMALINEQLRQTTARETQSLEDLEVLDEDEQDDDLNYPQSTPRQPLSSPSGKRSFDTSGQDSFYNKRQRIDKGKGKEIEIPSTPEDVINGGQTIRSSFQPSPLNYTSAQPEHQDDEGDESESDELYIRPPNFQRAVLSAVESRVTARALEPETQDFHFPPEQEEDIHAALDDLTPSPVRSSAKIPDRSRASDVATHGTVHSSNKNEDSSTQSQTESQRKEELQAFVDNWVSLGYPLDTVIEALEITTMETPNAGYVMEQLMEGAGVPEDIPGVWTWYEDEALDKRKDSLDFEKVVRKHGIKRCAVRKKFLKDQKSAAKQSLE
ncbi:hypothetical protein EG329_013731 [Mollisiaceae sp. DMI_Dod_QoI]|nr:hypothetical protein EG329_013731 [Helotiales sp. DMI_Dod_QoI]